MSEATGGQAGAAAASGTTGAGTGQAGGSAGSASATGMGASASGSGGTTDWTSGLNDEHKGWVQSKGFKDVSNVVESYLNAEKLVSKLSGGTPDQVMLYPKDGNLEPIYDRLGRPKTPTEYKLPGEKPGVEPDEFTKWAKDTFHKQGLNQKQAETLYQEMTKFSQGRSEKSKEAMALKSQQEAKGLETKWGAAYEQNLNIVDRAAAEFGIGEKELTALRDTMGPGATAELLYRIGSKLGEDSFVRGDGQGSGGTRHLAPESAQARIKALREDHGFVKRYTEGDISAREEMDRLHQYAYPQQTG